MILYLEKWDVNCRDNKGGNTALHFASYNGDVTRDTSHVAEEVVKWLIERGANRGKFVIESLSFVVLTNAHNQAHYLNCKTR